MIDNIREAAESASNWLASVWAKVPELIPGSSVSLVLLYASAFMATIMIGYYYYR